MSTFVASYIERTGTFQIPVVARVAFPLFEPIGEKKWAPGWAPKFIYPLSENPQEGAVFLTSTHHEETAHAVWLMSHYEPENFWVEYVRIVPESRIGKVIVRCTELTETTTEVQVTYTFTALGETGNRFIEEFNEEHYQKMLAEWQTQINYYLEHGHVLPDHS